MEKSKTEPSSDHNASVLIKLKDAKHLLIVKQKMHWFLEQKIEKLTTK